MNTMKAHNFFRPMTKDNRDILISGKVIVHGMKPELDSQGQHLTCFAGGMVGIGSKIFARDELDIARRLAEGCIWAYESMPTGIMPEIFQVISCEHGKECLWSEEKWHREVISRHGDTHLEISAESLVKGKQLQPGFTNIPDRRYILRQVPFALSTVMQQLF